MTEHDRSLHVVRPVCAECMHRADAEVMDQKEPWRDWMCLASPKTIWAERYNPITGITTPAVNGHKRCIDVNGEEQCKMFRPMESVAGPADFPAEPVAEATVTHVEPAAKPFTRSWLRRLLQLP